MHLKWHRTITEVYPRQLRHQAQTHTEGQITHKPNLTVLMGPVPQHRKQQVTGHTPPLEVPEVALEVMGEVVATGAGATVAVIAQAQITVQETVMAQAAAVPAAVMEEVPMVTEAPLEAMEAAMAAVDMEAVVEAAEAMVTAEAVEALIDAVAVLVTAEAVEAAEASVGAATASSLTTKFTPLASQPI